MQKQPHGSDPIGPSPSIPHDAELDALRKLGTVWPDKPLASILDGIHPDLDANTVEQEHAPDHLEGGGRHPKDVEFRNLSAGVIQATESVPRARSSILSAIFDIRALVIGIPLSNEDAEHERLTKVKALAVLSSDALSSVAYATGQLTAVLAYAGLSALGVSLPIAGAIALLLGVVALSYRQTIKAYPKGGGSYIVARDNLGDLAGLTAGSSLMIDYVLTVAVSITAGVAALQSLLPSLGPYTVEISIVVVIVLLLGNLRGIRESGSIFMLPTYLFVVGIFAMIAVGFVQFFQSGSHVLLPHPLAASVLPPGSHPIPTGLHGSGIEGLGIFLVLRAFASGCTALTGVEAISDGVPAFKTVKGKQLTEWRNARTTLTIMAALAIGMFIGITVLVHLFGLVPTDGDNPPTLLSQLASHIFGTGAPYWYVQITTALILALAANTAYSDFPRLLFFMARDGFVPHQFADRGDRLSYSNGIILLTLLASVLIIETGGSVNDLINLYVIGVFNSFTLSQASMVKRWWMHRKPGLEGYVPQWRRNILLNGTGTVATFIVLIVTAVTKFTHGAWLVVVLVPLLVTLFWRIRSHYALTKRQLEAETPLAPDRIRHTVIAPIADLNRPALQTLAYARTMTDRVIAVHVSASDEDKLRIVQKWEAWGDHLPLVIIDSPFRAIIPPLLAYIDAIDRQTEGDTITIILPEFVPAHWWDNILHNQTAFRLKTALLFRRGTVVISVPYHLGG